jgi:GH18 family chitinase
VFDGVQLWIEKGGLPEKLVLGIATYGRGFVLENPMYDGSYCPTIDGLPAAPYTNQSGMWGYQEILMYQQAAQLPDFLPEAEPLQWKIVVDNCYKAPYMGKFFSSVPSFSYKGIRYTCPSINLRYRNDCNVLFNVCQ